MKTAHRGFTIVELLITLAIIGVIVAIAIPNLLNALHRGKQKRTMSDIRTVATANESYAIDNNLYVVAGSGSATLLATYLEPTYTASMPRKDGWGSDLVYSAAGQEYTITSYGRDKLAGGGGNVGLGGQTTSFRNDIIFALGSFYQYPEGVQQ